MGKSYKINTMMKFINTIGIILSLLTAIGVFVHDTRIDKATYMSKEYSYKHGKTSTTDAGIMTDPHIHPERAQRTLNGLAYQSPSIHPREDKSKRYLMQNSEPRGRHAFDNYYLPIVA